MNAKYLIAWLCLVLGTGSVWPATFVVNSSVDSHDVAPGDGVANDHVNPDSAHCTLRAAIEEAGHLAGPDTILVQAQVGPFFLRLGVLRVLDNGTCLTGLNGRPVIDGVGNIINHASLVLESDSNTVCNLHFKRSRGDGITVFGASNVIGGLTPGAGVLLAGNGLDNRNAGAIRITGAQAVGNLIAGNYIGLSENGMTPNGNRYGVVIEHLASDNLIGSLEESGRNLISGNEGYGVIISSGANHNQVAGNYIGPDSTGNSGPGNQLGGILVTGGAHNNLLGGDDLDQGNLISGNQGPGVALRDPDVTANTVNGNLIGTNASGRYPLGNGGDGIRLTEGAHDNLIGGPESHSGNLVSGNAGSGICLRGDGVTGNLVTANWIGLSLSGYGAIGNGWSDGDGILLDSGAHRNTIGGLDESSRNVVSGNFRFGIHLDGAGTDNNQVVGNFVGVNATGTSSLGNACGVVISGGAQYNTVGGLESLFGNIISGNRADDFPYGAGVLIYGSRTDFNTISANIIGLDVTGYRPRRNGTAGVIIGGGAQYNLVGGDNISDGNIISGNGIDEPVDGRAAGIHIFGVSTRYNRVVSNFIGLSLENSEIIGNNGHGIGIYSGASYNEIGGETFRQTNQIVGSAGAGVFIAGAETRSNLIRYNLIEQNDGLGIDIRDSAQNGIYPPRITTVGILTVPGPRAIGGRDAPPGARIDIYEASSPPDPSGSGEGVAYLASTYANANGFFNLYLPHANALPIVVTAIATDSDNNSSEFAVNGYSPDATAVEDDASFLPQRFSLNQNYPNPFNAGTVISFSVPRATEARLVIFNVLGQRVRSLVNRHYSPGNYAVLWDGRNAQGHPIASGAYFYRLDIGDQTATRKMLLLK